MYHLKENWQCKMHFKSQPESSIGSKKYSGKNWKHGAGRFFTERSRELFEKLTIDSAFMTDYPPQTWSGLAEYKNAQGTVSSLRVVIDAAERGVRLVTDYSQILTKDEQQL